MRNPSTIVFCTIILLIISACANTQLNYQIDPEIKNISQIGNNLSLVAISVKDNRSKTQRQETKEVKFITMQKNDASLIKAKLLENFKQNNIKIISNPLLADISFELQIEELKISIDEGVFKSKIRATSHLRMIAVNNGQVFNKLYKVSRNQDIANPANSNDITGLVNQVLSKQLSAMLSDPGLTKLASI